MKYVTCEEFVSIRKKLKKQGLKIVHCHGVFDLLHPGHIAHFEEAKRQGDILVISVTSAKYVKKMPGRPYFSDELRIKSLISLSFVDYVLLSESITAIDMIEVIRPDYYVKGSEYKISENDITQNIDVEIEKVRSYGGNVYFTSDNVVFSSTKLLNNNFSSLSTEYLKEFSNQFSFEQVKNIIDNIKNIKILVVGDIIIDEYIFCNVQGLISKDRALSGRYLKEERYFGGSLAVANHLSGLCDNVTICSMIGEEPNILNNIHVNKELIVDKNYKTTIKRRYIEKHGMREDYDKLFSINYFNENNFDKSAFSKKLLKIIHNYDLVVVTDYGHGLIDSKIIDILQNNSKFLAVNCQTNSSNYGLNLITKYNNVNLFSVDEKELKLVGGDLQELMIKLNAQIGWETKGSNGAIGATNYNDLYCVPALTLTVQDTIGAGDAFYSLVAACSYLNAPFEISTFLGSIAGAMISNVLGNSKSINKIDLLKFASTVMNI